MSSIFLPPAPTQKPIAKCSCCNGTEYAEKNSNYVPITDIQVKSAAQVAWVKYFEPGSFLLYPCYGDFLKRVLQERSKEEDTLSYHIENSENYDYVRKNYIPADPDSTPITFVSISAKLESVKHTRYCVKCYNDLLKAQIHAKMSKLFMEVVAKPELFAFPYKKKPYGSQLEHVRVEGTINLSARNCSSCAEIIHDCVLYVGSPVHENIVLCMPCVTKYHREL